MAKAELIARVLFIEISSLMANSETQVNVRLTDEELDHVDLLRRAREGEISRTELLRSLLRERRRAVVDLRLSSASPMPSGWPSMLIDSTDACRNVHDPPLRRAPLSTTHVSRLIHGSVGGLTRRSSQLAGRPERAAICVQLASERNRNRPYLHNGLK